MTNNQQAFLYMLAWSEIGPALLAVSDRGYNVLQGSTPQHPLLFTDYSTHPTAVAPPGRSTAAGRYQLLHRYYEPYRKLLGLSDFGPSSQDAIAIQQIKECRALSFIEAGRIEDAICACAHIWASFVGASYGQHEHTMLDLLQAYQRARATHQG